jgi:hypothetical protein
MEARWYKPQLSVNSGAALTLLGTQLTLLHTVSGAKLKLGYSK